MEILNVETKRRKISLPQITTIFCLLILGLLQSVQAQQNNFAQINQPSGNVPPGFFFTNNGGTSGTLASAPGGTPIEFRYQNVNGLLDPSLQGTQCAILTMQANTNTPALPQNPPGVRQDFQTVSIVITRCQPAPVGRGNRNILLQVTITTGRPNIFGDLGERSATFAASTPGENVTFYSDFLDFNGSTNRNFSLSFSDINPALTLGPGDFLNSFSAYGSGTFAANPIPTVCCITTAASVNISGRIMAPNGRGLSNATVMLTQADGTVQTTRSTSLGYYRFTDISAGQSVIVNVASKRYVFQPSILNLAEEVQGLDFLSVDPNSGKP